MSEKLLTGTYCMRGSRNFCQVGGGGGQARLPENSSDNVFLVLNLFYSFTVVYQWFISMKTIISRGFRGGPTFSRGGGGPTFFRGGLNANLYRIYDFPGGPDHLSPLWIRTCTGITSKNDHPSTCLHFKNKAKSSSMITIFIERQRYIFMNLN